MEAMRVFVSTHPFGSVSEAPLRILRENGIEVVPNPYQRKIRIDELKEHIKDKTGLIAGTESLGADVLAAAPQLKIISRVGIGLDGIDFEEIRRRNILLTYTPEAVSQAVAELTVGNLFNLARSIPQVHRGMKSGLWSRPIGFEIKGKCIGIIGFGRVGQRVARMLQGFDCQILVNDLSPDEDAGSLYGVRFVDKEAVYRDADIITLHVPKTPLTWNMVADRELAMMKRTACLINTSRGGIVNEGDLYNALKSGMIAGAALDVYEMEPYIGGALCELDNIILTCHSGSCSAEARYLMELGAAEEIVRFSRGEQPRFPVPNDVIQMERSHHVVPVNAEWHQVVNHAPVEHSDERYKLYRKQWGQYPTYFMVAPFALNVDIELVCNPHRDGDSLNDWFLSERGAHSKFMNMVLLDRILAELKLVKEPFAVRLGFRGDPLGHPEIIGIVAKLKSVGAVEIIVSTRAESCSEEMVEHLLQSGINILNIYIPRGEALPRAEGHPGKAKAISERLEFVWRQRSLSGSVQPRIRIFTEFDMKDQEGIKEFTRFWGHWADVIAVVDKEVDSIPPVQKGRQWACSRLWQRLVVGHDGKLLACNYDVRERLALGMFPEMTIREAWNGRKMGDIRKAHEDDGSGTLEACATCVFRTIELSKL